MPATRLGPASSRRTQRFRQLSCVQCFLENSSFLKDKATKQVSVQ